MIKEELVYDLNVFDLNKQDDKWKKFWKHFVASCSPKASVTPNLCQREFMRVKYGSPQIIKDNWKELIKKTNPFSRWLRSRGAEWSVSDGKLSRSSNANPDLYHATMTLSEILGEDLIGQRRGKKAWQPSCAPSCWAASLSPSSLMSSHSLLRCVPLNCSQAISITPTWDTESGTRIASIRGGGACTLSTLTHLAVACSASKSRNHITNCSQEWDT